MLKLPISTIFVLTLFYLVLLSGKVAFAQSVKAFEWPDGKQVALSLSFDDARLSQVDTGTELFNKYGAKSTFYVVPDNMKPRLDGWKQAVKSGHEIGNHTLYHPCTANFSWARGHSLEDYTLADMRSELNRTNQQIEEMLGVKAVSYAYTCGHTFVGRGLDTKSYVPLISEMFESGRGWLDEGANAPGYLDMAQLLGIEMDGKDFNQIKPLLEDARKNNNWVVLAGHEIGTDGTQTTRTTMLEELIEYAQNPENNIWLATVGEIASYVKNSGYSLSDAAFIQNKKNLQAALTFYASFDGTFDADFAKGNSKIYTAPAYDKLSEAKLGMNSDDVVVAQGKGKYHDALEFKRKGKQVLYYTSEQNIAYDKEDWSGTISLWLSLNPEEDLEPGYTDPIQITDVAYNDAALWVDFTDKNPRKFRMGIFGDLTVWNPKNISPDDNPDFNNRLVVADDGHFGSDRWTHVVISYSNLNTSSAKADFYVNGKLQGSTANIPEPFTWELAKSKIFLGLNYTGLMDEVALFDKALTSEEVSFLYQLHNGVKTILPQKGY